MPWIVGIDEAGYGPNLGPLVQAAIGCRVGDEADCLWRRLAPAVRRASDTDDGRLLIDDSKRVYAGPNGLSRLELGVGAALASLFTGPVSAFLDCIGVGSTTDDLRGEAWYDGSASVPV